MEAALIHGGGELGVDRSTRQLTRSHRSGVPAAREISVLEVGHARSNIYLALGILIGRALQSSRTRKKVGKSILHCYVRGVTPSIHIPVYSTILTKEIAF